MLRSSVRTARVRRALATLAFWLVVAVSLSFSARGRSAGDAGSRARPSVAGNPLRSLARPLAPPEHLRGAVRERLVAGSYAYLRVAMGPGQERWLATIGAGRALGECVDVTAYAMAPSFESPRLNRRFESLLFGSARPCH
ncbi:MAG: hypothetical protein JNK05_12525 [Myxococcales bacterium]|nr:hypothetical protein [Myxococcales bacterium]